MKKFLGFFIVFLFTSSVFATSIVTNERMVTAPGGGGYYLNHVWAGGLALRSNQLTMDVRIEWEAWRDPRYPDSRYYTKTVDLEFPEVVYNTETKELSYKGSRIGEVREKCRWYGCSQRVYLDSKYQLSAYSRGVSSMIDVSGELFLFDNK